MSVNTDIKLVDNVFVKMMTLGLPGDKVEGHAHAFDHITLLSKGRVIMRAKGEEKEHSAPKLIVTPKGIVHEFEALESSCVLCCVHAIRDGEGVDDVAPPTITEREGHQLLDQYSLTLPDQP
jgi:quercetin dioxygenase-like cupin family protein